MSETNNEDLERNKLILEISQLENKINTPWYKRSEFISVLIPAILTIFSLFILYKAGSYDERSQQFSLERKSLEIERAEIENFKNEIDYNIKMYSDSLDQFKTKYFHSILQGTIQNSFITKERSDNEKLHTFLQSILFDSSQTKESLINKTARFLIKKDTNYTKLVEQNILLALERISDEKIGLPQKIRTELRRDSLHKDDILITFRFIHRYFPGAKSNTTWKHDLENFGEVVKLIIENILWDNQGRIDKIEINGNANDDRFSTKYDGSLGDIEGIKYTYRDYRDSIRETKMYLYKGSHFGNKELSFLRGFIIKDKLEESKKINSYNIKLISSLNESRGSRDIEVNIKIKNCYTKFKKYYRFDEDVIRKYWNKYYNVNDSP
ncbi:hypothetical protein [Flavivirga jejuensis]|uniref:Phage abortive infection protein n=1 Tax=Flavivirga jejuensis TaxID=870487 RepID=A0ABT8WTA1_9FLAO|nr:hypothetical protein [Flavivirga jejuensis]MDO5976225.1 hypothetical protein [Flavivirga jejuensis]